MKSTWFVSVAVGASLLIQVLTAEATTIVSRVDGHACNVDPDFDYFMNASSGLTMDDIVGGTAEAVCAIPIGPSTVTLSDLYYVAFRGRTTGTAGENVDVALYAHDYDSSDYCQCDFDTNTSASNGAYWLIASYYSGANGHCDDVDCPGAAPGGAEPATDWLVDLDVLLHDVQGGLNTLTIKYLAVYSDL